MEPEGLRLTVDGPVARVVLDRPEVRNAQTPAMWRALAEFGAGLPGEVRVVVVSGEGPSFSAGLDRRLFAGDPASGEESLTALGHRPAAEVHAAVAAYQAGFSWLRRPEVVSVAAVQGHAVGAGFQLALACDLRVATPDARFSMREVTLGLVPDLGGTQPLTQLVGYSRALELCVTGRTVEAGEAQHLGLVNLVVPAAELGDAVEDLTGALLGAPVGAVRETKALLLAAGDSSYDEQLRAEREAQQRRLATMVRDGGKFSQT